MPRHAEVPVGLRGAHRRLEAERGRDLAPDILHVFGVGHRVRNLNHTWVEKKGFDLNLNLKNDRLEFLNPNAPFFYFLKE